VSDSIPAVVLEATVNRRKSLLSKADGEGFEPPVPRGTPVFKTGASATRPHAFYPMFDAICRPSGTTLQ